VLHKISAHALSSSLDKLGINFDKFIFFLFVFIKKKYADSG
jgi:hypothetical protein